MLDEFGQYEVLILPIAGIRIRQVWVGAAMNGLKANHWSIMTFQLSFVAIDQSLIHAAKMLAMSGRLLVGHMIFRGFQQEMTWFNWEATHSSNFWELVCKVSLAKVIRPVYPYDAKGLMKAAFVIQIN